MIDEKILKMFAVILALRANYWNSKDDHFTASAYRNALDMFIYAYEGNWDCLRQFGFSDEAEELVNKMNVDLDLHDLEKYLQEQEHAPNYLAGDGRQ